MKTLPAGMQADLDSGTTTLCTCWKLVRRDGTVLGFTDHDRDVTFDSLVFKAATGMTGSSSRNSIGLNIDTTEGLGFLDSDSITEEDIRKKLYDHAQVAVYRVDWKDVTKRLEVFTGYLGQVTRTRNTYRAEVSSLSAALSQAIGRVYQKTCDVDLFSPKCGKHVTDSTDYQKSSVVGTPLSRRLFEIVDPLILGFGTDWFTGGKLTWLTGANAGVSIEVRSWQLSTDEAFATVDLWEGMTDSIVAGDTFTIQVGCDKSVETCKAKFDNVINFRGFPRMPGQDAVVAVAHKTNINDGGSWYR